MAVVYKLIRPELKVASDGVITATLSDGSEDRDGDTIDPNGWELDGFLKHPVLVSSHDYSDLRKQIGQWNNVRVENSKLVGEPEYYTGQGNTEADWAYTLASKYKAAAFSVGFQPIESAPRKGRGQSYKRQGLLETSQVIIPAHPGALQNAIKAMHPGPIKQYAEDALRHKWSSNTMDSDADDQGWAPADIHCIVPGCDDASQLQVPICSEHLKVLMNADAEPPGGELDENAESLDYMMRALSGRMKRVFKAGRTISGGNMQQVHSILNSAQALHDAGNCTDGDCEYGGEASADEAKAVKAMGEASGAAGGATVSDGGTHGAFDGTHTHDHAANGAQGADALHGHEHTHDGNGDHGHAHANGKGVAPNETKQFSMEAFGASLENSLVEAMEAL